MRLVVAIDVDGAAETVEAGVGEAVTAAVIVAYRHRVKTWFVSENH